MTGFTVSMYGCGGGFEPKPWYEPPVVVGTDLRPFGLPEQRPAVEADVARIKAEGVSAVAALRILSALGWDADRAVAVVRAAREDGANPVEFAREIGGAK